jgi:diguanylate cyclase (GGDEF)-like protein
MNDRIFTNNYLSWIIAALIVIAAACNFAGGMAGTICFILCLLCALALLVIRWGSLAIGGRKKLQIQASDTRLQLFAQKQVGKLAADVQVSSLGAGFRNEQWALTERTVDAILDSCISLVASRVGAHTVAVFFPDAGEGYAMRRHFSRSNDLLPSAVIKPGLGILGGLLKSGLKILNLRDITNDSTTLYYYKTDVGIRSLLACPIIAGERERGLIIADSTEKSAFTDDHIGFVSSISAILGQAVYHTYLHTEHSLSHLRLAAVSTIEKEFFRHQSIDAILDILAEVIPFALPCDRLSISMRSDNGETAAIKRTFGSNAEHLSNLRFSLHEKTLASILYGKNICFSRNFAHDRYEPRYLEKEQKSGAFVSFLAVPIGVDDCKGMILIESVRRDVFSDPVRELLSRIATSAGLAIEKMLILEKARTLATHDGLTGLFNHRQFQQLLGDEMTRSTRYNDPLSLVLCDIDFFKKVNDTWGHQFGDIVLKEVARVFEASIRQGIDTASRYGGEEFALILVKTGEEQAIETAERIRASIAKVLFKSPSGNDVHITMSFGIAVYGKHAREPGEIIKKADKALYRAKEQGRNRVEVF